MSSNAGEEFLASVWLMAFTVVAVVFEFVVVAGSAVVLATVLWGGNGRSTSCAGAISLLEMQLLLIASCIISSSVRPSIEVSFANVRLKVLSLDNDVVAVEERQVEAQDEADKEVEAGSSMDPSTVTSSTMLLSAGPKTTASAKGVV